MRGRAVILLFLMVFPAVVLMGLAAQVPEQLAISLRFDNAEVVTKADGVHVEGNGFVEIGEPGDPAVPVVRKRIVLPPQADPSSVQITVQEAATDQRVISGLAPIGSLCGPDGRRIARNDGIDLVERKNVAVYEADQWFPSARVGSVRVDKYRGILVADVLIHVGRYQPVSRTWEQVREMTLAVSWQKRDVDITSDATIPAGAETLAELATEYHVQDLETLIDWYRDFLDDLLGFDYLIITTSAIDNEGEFNGLDDFVEHKRQQGFRPHVETIADICAAYPSVDRPRAIKEYIQDFWKEHGQEFVLLVGNPDRCADYAHSLDSHRPVPMRLCYTPASDLGENETVYSMTDAYYADLGDNRTWDNDGDGRYAEGWSAPGTIDLCVGRIAPAGGYVDDIVYGSSTETVAREDKLKEVFKQIILWDREIDADRDAMLVAGSYLFGTGEASAAVHLTETIRQIRLIDSSFWAYTCFQNGEDFGLASDDWFDSDLSNGEATSDLNGGHPSSMTYAWDYPYNNFGLTFWNAHGAHSMCSVGSNNSVDEDESTADGNMISRSDLFDWSSEYRSAVFSASCLNMEVGTLCYNEGEYQHQRDRWANLASVLHYKAAVAVAAFTQVSYGDFPENINPCHGSINYMQRDFLRCVAGGCSYGEAIRRVRDNMSGEFSSGHLYELFNFLRLNFLGDPSQTHMPDLSYLSDDDLEAGGGDDDAARANVVWDGYAEYGTSLLRRPVDIEITWDNMVSWDEDWYVLDNLGEDRFRVGATIVAFAGLADVSSDLPVTFYDADFNELEMDTTPYGEGFTYGWSDYVSTPRIYMRVEPCRYVADYDLTVYLQGWYTTFDSLPPVIVP